MQNNAYGFAFEIARLIAKSFVLLWSLYVAPTILFFEEKLKQI